MSAPDSPKQPKKKKNIIDVEKSEDAKPSQTSKPVIVTNRPILKDPMVVNDAPGEADEPDGEKPNRMDLKRSTAPNIRPLTSPAKEDEPEAQPKEAAPEPAQPDKPDEPNEAPAAKQSADEPDAADADMPGAPTKSAADVEKQLSAEAAKKAEHEAEIQKLVDEGKYTLPISTIEKRQARHFVILGAVAAVALILVWFDLALDASLIHIGGLHPATHFFSN